MANIRPATVTDRDGVRGLVDDAAALRSDRPARVHVRLENGSQVTVPGNMLEARPGDGYFFADSFARLAGTARAGGGEEMVLPVIAEELVVGKKQAQTGTVRITKRVQEHEEVVDEPGFAEEVTVERVPLDRVVHALPEVRYEGDTMIVPVVEERVVVEKRLVLKEELRITRHRTEIHDPQRVTLRREEAEVTRLTGKGAEEENSGTP